MPQSISMQGTSGAEAAGKPAGPGWADRYLPARGFERIAYLILAGLILGMKVLAIYHFRSDSDETQHAHVIWGWVTGQLQYRDCFDNHMPLFQMAWAPLMALFGERADIMIWLRWTMLPLYLASLWCVYRLADLLFGRWAAPWTMLLAAGLWKFFYTSTEFRTDQLWTDFWLLSLVAAVNGPFTVRRAFGFGLLLGLAGAVSVKTVPLVVALATAAALAMALAWLRGERPPAGGMAARLAAMGGGVAIPPAAMGGYFLWKGAFKIMYYCVITHNMVPGLKRWGHFSLHQWYYPLSVPLLGACAWLIFRHTPDTRLAVKRSAILLAPWFYLALLWSYWPDITREDDLPYVPLTLLSFIPLLMLAGRALRDERWRGILRTYGLPALALCDIAMTWRYHDIREDRMRVTTHNIQDVLTLTKPGDYVMDDKGDYIYRRRAYYWVLEPITKARVRMGLIHDNIPMRMIEHGVKLCSMQVGRPGSRVAQFIVSNYLPFDPETRDMGLLGKLLTSGTQRDRFAFDVVIPQRYDVIAESGPLAGELDGKPYTGPVWLAAGSHEFHRTAGTGRLAIFLDDAYRKGRTPLFDLAEHLAKTLGTLPEGKREIELQ